MDNLSHYLIEFQYTKFDEVEVPGQYTEVQLIIISTSSVIADVAFRTKTTTRTS